MSCCLELSAQTCSNLSTAWLLLGSKDTYLLGKFQVVAVPALADYDAGFNSLQAVNSGWWADGN